jgi:hypothetical protein
MRKAVVRNLTMGPNVHFAHAMAFAMATATSTISSWDTIIIIVSPKFLFAEVASN